MILTEITGQVLSLRGRQNTKLYSYQALICALFATSIFSLRWINCLPFSGYMPVIKNGDILTAFGSFLIYAKEPFDFPIGLIKGLSFPLHINNISRNSIPLFAIPLKLLSKFYAPLSEYYYFVLAELIFVFLTAYFAGLLLIYFKVKSFWLRLLGSVLCSLSFVLLFRSSDNHGLSYEVGHFPLYLAGAYFYLQLATRPSRRSFVLFALLFPIAALTDASYLLFGISFMACVCLVFNSVEFTLNQNGPNRKRLILISSAFLIGMLLTLGTFYIMGNYYTLMEMRPGLTPLYRRYAEEWGYGGGYGGGFHVADVFTLFIPQGERALYAPVPVPTTISYLAKLSFPITTDNYQAGQYEGFAYLGTTVLGIICGLAIINLILLIRNPKTYSARLESKWTSKLYVSNVVFPLPLILGISSFMLYVLSWGYIIHVLGNRIHEIPTPSLILAIVWPKFMLLRAIGRLAFPFALFITLGTIVWLDRYLDRYTHHSLSKGKKMLLSAFIIILVLIHVYEIRGYLKPSEVTYGNDIDNVFDEEDIRSIKVLLQDKRALMIVPHLRSNFSWKKIGNSLAFHSGIPISGTNVGLGVRGEAANLLQSDISTILMGNVREIIDKYGDVAIAAPSDIAKDILSKTNISLKCYELQSQDVMILALDE